MRTESTVTVFRKDYLPPSFWVDSVEIALDLDPECTLVAARLHVRRNAPGPLVLDGDDIALQWIAIDGRRLTRSQYRLRDKALIIHTLPDSCVVDIVSTNRPNANTSLSGLYVSQGTFITQCEAEGFRRITYFPDRPDVMARFTVMLRADQAAYPVLLSNGNLVEQGQLPGGRHYAKWEDPFPKPSYLFAVVAGKMAYAERGLRTASGRDVILQIYAAEKDLPQTSHAMDALVNSLRWDEKRFGLELDLDRFMIVGTSDFNMGAMENKGLNIFNAKYLLASPETSTDADFASVEAIVGHEYFHNWTGNRVTCRDWFQLTLKEGLTVFRDHEFSADMAAGYMTGEDHGALADAARAVNRISSVRVLRSAQFPEDAGPMAHPVRPDSFQEINNFYTPTVYEKGSEIIRMLQTLIGREGFREGIDEYFRRHDGCAVTCDDFVDAMELVYKRNHPKRSLDVFRRWYSQAGTPRVSVTTTFDAAAKTLSLRARQICPKVGEERQRGATKLPFHIPLSVGLLDKTGHDLPLKLRGAPASAKGAAKALPGTVVLDFTEDEQTFVFEGVLEAPTPSLLRGFSAPVHLDYAYTSAELALLAAHDSDAFNRWEAGQRLFTRELVKIVKALEAGDAVAVDPAVIDVFRQTLLDASLDPALKELALSLPSESMVGEGLAVYLPQQVHAARQALRHALAAALRNDWIATYQAHATPGPYVWTPVAAGHRALQNLSLSYLCALDEDQCAELAWQQFEEADNMSARLGAMRALSGTKSKRQKEALDAFYIQFEHDPAVIDKWFALQAGAPRTDRPVLEVVTELARHPAFALTNPNKVYALFGSFFNGNPAEFHRADGSAYQFWAEQVLALDAINPSVAGRIARALDRWKKLPESLQLAAKAALTRVQAAPALSSDVAEIIGKALNA